MQMTRKTFWMQVLVTLLIISMLPLASTGEKTAQAASTLIERVNTDKAMYSPGESVSLYVDLVNRTQRALTGTVSMKLTHLGERVETMNQPVQLSVGASTTSSFNWSPPLTDFKGYHVEVVVSGSDGTVLDRSATAVDVSSDWKKFPRYGFLSSFSASEVPDPYNWIWQMKNYHLNGIQFYDWQWKHHIPYSPAAQWPEIANRPVDRKVIEDFIQASHQYGMMAMNYNLINGAYDRYWEDGSGVQLSWGLFRNGNGGYTQTDQDQHCCLPPSWATETIYLFNPAHTGWQSYLFQEEAKVFQNLGFDGWHIDSLGDRGALWDSQQQPVDLKLTFAPFVNNARTQLDKRMVFNSVGTYGQDEIASGANVDFVYSELWDDPGTLTYGDLNRIAEDVQVRTDKAIVFAAYMNRDYSKSIPDGQTAYFNEPGIRLANSTIFAAGASHIELGDGDGMLSTEYFVDQKLKMSDSLRDATLDQYHFLTAYENLLRDGMKRGNHVAELTGYPTSMDGESGKIWTLAKSKPGVDVLHLINLKNSVSDRWRDPNANAPAPDVLSGIPVKWHVEGTLAPNAKLYMASPEIEHGKPQTLSYTTGQDAKGRYLSFQLPSLHYWDMLWIDKQTETFGTIALDENFETAFNGAIPANWQAESGNWSVQQPAGHSKEMTVSQGGILSYQPGFSQGDYDLSAHVFLPDQQTNAALLARKQFAGGFYQLELKDGSQWALWKKNNDSSWRELASGSFPYEANSYHYMQMSLTGTTISVSIDLQPLAVVTDEDQPFYRGTVGLRSENEARFDNIQVELQ
ncbi:glycoside hydrolase family 66 protein [Marinicrinis sediminis]|uniref:Glycoside hydrolase family 66 protein n=1 Tax=Marinicrinis sediminis TaxID=1652465 RepID=A0ABW5R986_9BACL